MPRTASYVETLIDLSNCLSGMLESPNSQWNTQLWGLKKDIGQNFTIFALRFLQRNCSWSYFWGISSTRKGYQWMFDLKSIFDKAIHCRFFCCFLFVVELQVWLYSVLPGQHLKLICKWEETCIPFYLSFTSSSQKGDSLFPTQLWLFVDYTFTLNTFVLTCNQQKQSLKSKKGEKGDKQQQINC